MEDEIIDEFKELPKNVVYVSFMRRVGASILDSIVIGPITFAMTYFAGGQQLTGLLIVPPVISLLYKVVLEKEFGQTLGKKVVGIAVVNEDLQKISLAQSLIRNYYYVITMVLSIIGDYALAENNSNIPFSGYGDTINYITYAITLGWFIDCIMMSSEAKNQTLHDKWANTYVVKDTFLIK